MFIYTVFLCMFICRWKRSSKVWKMCLCVYVFGNDVTDYEKCSVALRGADGWDEGKWWSDSACECWGWSLRGRKTHFSIPLSDNETFRLTIHWWFQKGETYLKESLKLNLIVWEHSTLQCTGIHYKCHTEYFPSIYHAHTYYVFIFYGFHICKFMYLLKIICNPNKQ